MTGLRVTNLESERLSLKRSVFRQSIGYAFSTLFFGIGFLSVLKDPERQAFHDKAVGSRVWKISNLWPIGLLVLVGLIAFNIYSATQAVTNFNNNTILKAEYESFRSDLKNAEPPDCGGEACKMRSDSLDLKLDNIPEGTAPADIFSDKNLENWVVN